MAYVGGGNGDPSCHMNDRSATRPAYHGRVLGIVRAGVLGTEAAGMRSESSRVTRLNESGLEMNRTQKVTVRVTSPGLEGDELTVLAVPPTSSAPGPAWWCRRAEQL